MIIHRSLTRRQKIASVALSTGLLVAGLIILLNQERLVVFQQPDTGLTFSHSPQLVEAEVGNADRDSGILNRWQVAPETGIALLITLRKEQELSKAANLTGEEPIGIILNTISRTYPRRFPGYSELSRREFEQSSRPAAEIIFTYDGETGERVKQRFIAIMKDDDQALYLSLQAKDSEFDALNTRFFNAIANSLAFD